jgi:hypothetical protein
MTASSHWLYFIKVMRNLISMHNGTVDIYDVSAKTMDLELALTAQEFRKKH